MLFEDWKYNYYAFLRSAAIMHNNFVFRIRILDWNKMGASNND